MTKEVFYRDDSVSKDENSTQNVWERVTKEVVYGDNFASKDEVSAR